MNINLAKSAGFCFGVNRVINMVESALSSGKKICTLGNIIHNQNVINNLHNKGVRVINDVSEANNDEIIFVRSHGVSNDVYSQLLPHAYIDGTCPFVTKIHNIVTDVFVNHKTNEIIDYNKILIIIIGNTNHPEVKGIEGHCIYDFKTVADAVELEYFLKNNYLDDKYIKVVFQTTYQIFEKIKCVNVLNSFNINCEVFDTICNETKKRQLEAEQMSKVNDLMIVVGDKNSSNTQKLADVCKQNCETIFIESAQEIDTYNFKTYKNVGVTAGASTPPEEIENVIKKLQALNNNASSFKELKHVINEQTITQNLSADVDFLKNIDDFINDFSVGDTVNGKVVKVNNKEAQIDIGNQYDAYLPFSEVLHETNAKMTDLLKKGDELELVITKIDDVNGIIMLSKKMVDKRYAMIKLKNAFESGTYVNGIVTKILNNGVNADVNGVNVYINEYQIGLPKNQIYKLMNKSIKFKITRYDDKKIQGSIKEYNQELLWTSIKLGDRLTGVVTSLTNFGAFVNINGQNALIPIRELSWKKIKHPSEILKVGQSVECTVIELDYSSKKITLSYKSPKENPKILLSNYKVGDVVEVTIVSITPFGAFAQIAPNIDGLIHISDIKDEFITSVRDHLEVGQKVRAKIINIDYEKKRIRLSLKEVNFQSKCNSAN